MPRTALTGINEAPSTVECTSISACFGSYSTNLGALVSAAPTLLRPGAGLPLPLCASSLPNCCPLPHAALRVDDTESGTSPQTLPP